MSEALSCRHLSPRSGTFPGGMYRSTVLAVRGHHTRGKPEAGDDGCLDVSMASALVTVVSPERSVDRRQRDLIRVNSGPACLVLPVRVEQGTGGRACFVGCEGAGRPHQMSTNVDSLSEARAAPRDRHPTRCRQRCRYHLAGTRLVYSCRHMPCTDQGASVMKPCAAERLSSLSWQPSSSAARMAL